MSEQDASVRTSLLKQLALLDDGSDMELVFKAADGSTDVVPGHSVILRLWSKVLAKNISVTRPSSTTGGTDKIRIDMIGISKEDWLLAMEFVYPVTPQPVVTWDNLELLLSIGDTYGMPALMHRVGQFLEGNVKVLNLEHDSKQFVWKWIMAADKYGLHDIAKACINAQPSIHELVYNFPQKQLSAVNSAWLSEHLSATTLQHLLVAVANQIIRPKQPYCPVCQANSWVHGQHDNRCTKCNQAHFVNL